MNAGEDSSVSEQSGAGSIQTGAWEDTVRSVYGRRGMEHIGEGMCVWLKVEAGGPELVSYIRYECSTDRRRRARWRSLWFDNAVGDAGGGFEMEATHR